MKEIVLVIIVAMISMLAVSYLAVSVWIFKRQLRELIFFLEMMQEEQDAIYRELHGMVNNSNIFDSNQDKIYISKR